MFVCGIAAHATSPLYLCISLRLLQAGAGCHSAVKAFLVLYRQTEMPCTPLWLFTSLVLMVLEKVFCIVKGQSSHLSQQQGRVIMRRWKSRVYFSFRSGPAEDLFVILRADVNWMTPLAACAKCARSFPQCTWPPWSPAKTPFGSFLL